MVAVVAADEALVSVAAVAAVADEVLFFVVAVAALEECYSQVADYAVAESYLVAALELAVCSAQEVVAVAVLFFVGVDCVVLVARYFWVVMVPDG